MPVKPLRCFWSAVFILGGALVVLGMAAAHSRTPVWHLVALAVGAHAPYGAALYIAWKCRPLPISVQKIIIVAMGLRLILVFAPPVFSDDLYRYIWDGRVLGNGVNPYRFAPNADELAPLRDRYWPSINHPSIKTIYPPLAELLFGGVSAVAPNPPAFKTLSSMADVGVVFAVVLLAGGRIFRRRDTESDQGQQRREERAVLAGLAYGLNPLAIVETGMSGHLEPLAILPLLLALHFVRRGKSLAASLLAAIGIGIKLLPILVYPIIAKRRLWPWLIMPLLLVCIYLPFLANQGAPAETLGGFVRRWEGNAGIFALVEWSIRRLLMSAYGVADANAVVHIGLLDDTARALQGTFFSLHMDSAMDEAAPGAFAIHDVSLAAAKLLLGGALMSIVVFAFTKEDHPLRGSGLILGALVLFTPVLHPWYLLWVLPLAAVSARWPWFVLSAALPLAYLPLDGWWSRGQWEAPRWVPWVEYGVFFFAFFVYVVTKKIQLRKQNT